MPHPKQGYRTKDGKRVPGVTTIIGRFKDSGALMWWAYSQGQANERGEIKSLYDKRDEAADSGTQAHELVERHIQGQKFIRYDFPNATDEGWQGFENYREWEANNNIVIVDQEMTMVSEEYRFGGSPDAIGVDSQDRFCILDWKTSNGVYTDMLIQLAAYKALWEENHPDQPITGGYHLCRFSKEHADFSHHYWSELTEAWEQFKLFRTAYDIDKRLKKRTG